VPSNLTRDEARGRARLLSVRSYQVELDLTGGETVFDSTATVRFSCHRPGASTFIELTAPAVSSITLNGQPVPPANFDGHRITLDDLASDNELRVTATCAYSRDGEGLHRFTDPADQAVYLYSDLETFDAHRVYACFDQPDLKAAFELSVTAPADWQVVSNAAPSSVASAQQAGTALWKFPPTPPLSTYITAVAAGPYHVVRDAHDGIALGIYCRRSLAGHLDPDEIFEVTRQGFDFFHAAFGVRYPFGKYDQLFVPEFKAGAMENAGCVTFSESYIFRSRVTDASREARAETILHEMAHMWFGDLVTMRWWDDLWLNESFAEFCGYLSAAEATRFTGAWLRRPRRPAGPARGRPSPRSCRGGRTGRTSCRPRTRSPPTSPTSRRSRSTSTGSPTPRARPCSSNSPPPSARRTSWPGCVPTSPSTPGAMPRWATCSPPWNGRRGVTCRPGPRRGWRLRA
jgi:aminopeptidase N